jgi:hypothetical protein
MPRWARSNASRVLPIVALLSLACGDDDDSPDAALLVDLSAIADGSFGDAGSCAALLGNLGLSCSDNGAPCTPPSSCMFGFCWPDGDGCLDPPAPNRCPASAPVCLNICPTCDFSPCFTDDQARCICADPERRKHFAGCANR